MPSGATAFQGGQTLPIIVSSLVSLSLLSLLFYPALPLSTKK